MKTIIKITAILAAIPVLVGCSSTSNQSTSSETRCPWTAQQLQADQQDQMEIAMIREYAKTGVYPKGLVNKNNMTPEIAALLVKAYDVSMTGCK